HSQRQAVDEWLALLVPERDGLEPDKAAQRRGRRGYLTGGALLGLVEEVEDALRGGNARLHHAHQAGHLRQRAAELSRVDDESLELADRQRAGQDTDAADDGDEDVADVV